MLNLDVLFSEKKQAMLIRAFQRFSLFHPKYTLSIYGEGPLLEYLTRLILELGMQEKIRLEGWSSQVHQEISDAEFFVLSSNHEGLSNALLEAMMMGFPVITTDCEGSTDVV